MHVDVYRNVNGGVWSLRDVATRRVFARATHVELREVSCVVSAAQRRRALREGVRNVHAVVRGNLVTHDGSRGRSRPTAAAGWVEVHYNPFRAGWFTARAENTTELCAVDRAERAIFDARGTAWMQGAMRRVLPPDDDLPLVLRALAQRRQRGIR